MCAASPPSATRPERRGRPRPDARYEMPMSHVLRPIFVPVGSRASGSAMFPNTRQTSPSSARAKISPSGYRLMWAPSRDRGVVNSMSNSGQLSGKADPEKPMPHRHGVRRECAPSAANSQFRANRVQGVPSARLKSASTPSSSWRSRFELQSALDAICPRCLQRFRKQLLALRSATRRATAPPSRWAGRSIVARSAQSSERKA